MSAYSNSSYSAEEHSEPTGLRLSLKIAEKNLAFYQSRLKEAEEVVSVHRDHIAFTQKRIAELKKVLGDQE